MQYVRPKKALGQHFLNDEAIAEAIALAIPQDQINTLEIGPGMGILTQFLMQRSGSFEAVDLDMESVNYLQKKYPTLNVRYQDFLKIPPEDFANPSYWIGNFPYNISSQILFRLLENRDKIPVLVGMFQKEVAERVVAHEGSKTYGILSVLLQAFYKAEYLFTVEAHHFTPPPKVRSAVIRLTRNDVQNLACDEVLFVQIVKRAFNQRRKTLRNALSGANVEKSLMQDPRFFDQRAEQLSVTDFIELCQWWQAHAQGPFHA